MQQEAQAFEQFWKTYPLRVAKIAARKAFEKALKQATMPQILAGLERYKAHKPAWQHWANPASWLNAGRWLDEYESDTKTAPREAFDVNDWAKRMGYCQHTPRCASPGGPECVALWSKGKAS